MAKRSRHFAQHACRALYSKKSRTFGQGFRAKNFRKEKTIKGLMLQLKKLKPLSEESERSMNDNFGHMATELFNNEARNFNKFLVPGTPRKSKSLPFH